MPPGRFGPPGGRSTGGLEERDEVRDFLGAELRGIVLRHDARREAGRDFLVRVFDRLLDEVGILALERLVEVGADRAVRPGRLEGVAAAAARVGEDRLAGGRIALLSLRQRALDRSR